MTTQSGRSTGRDDRPTFWCGGSLFNTAGQRLNELDSDTRRTPTTIAEMTPDDWAEAGVELRRFEAERKLR